MSGEVETTNPAEAVMYQALGLRKETGNIKWYSTLITQAAFRLYGRTPLNWVDIEGEFPTEGACIGISNHKGFEDILKGGLAAQETAGRTVFALARKSLLDPNYKESASYEQTGFLYTAPFWLRKFGADVMAGTGAAGVTRGANGTEVIRAVNRFVKNEVFIGWFINDHRQKDGSMRGIKEGIGYFLQKNPDLLVQPVAMYGPPDTQREGVRISPNRYNFEAILNHPTYRTDLNPSSAITLFLADEIADLMPAKPRQNWFEVERRAFLAGVNSKKAA